MLLGDMLVEAKVITADQLKTALDLQQKSGRKLGKLFVENGMTSEENVCKVIARQYRVPYVDLRAFNPTYELVRKLPEAHARHHKVIVLEDRSAKLLVGFADPSDLFAYDEAVRVLKREVEVAVVSESLLTDSLNRVYRRTDQITGLVKELEQEFKNTDLDNRVYGESSASDDAPVVRLLQTLFEDAAQVGCSDIHIEPQQDRLQIRFRIDGVLVPQTDVDLKIGPALMVRLKLMAGLDISEKRLPQDGRFALKIGDGQIDVRLSTVPLQSGESAVMRLLVQGGGARNLDRAGMPPEMLKRFRALSRRSSGLMLVTGPTGSGKTTTLYAALAELNDVDTKIITVEDPVEYRLAGVCQVQVNEKIDLTFGGVLRAVLRQDPYIILVGEMRDQETASIGLRAAITGHMVFSTLHTRDAIGTPVRLVDMGVPPVMVASALQAVLAQRLLRVNCEICVDAYTPSPQEMEWLKNEAGGVPAKATFMKGRGCPRCNNTGYKGRSGIYELLEMNSELASLITRGDTDQFSRIAREHMRGKTMATHAISIAASGRTTIAEVMRVASQAGE